MFQRSRLPFTLALATFLLALFSGGWFYGKTYRTVPALVPVRDIAAGTALQGDMVRVVDLPAGGRPERALVGPGQITGHYAAAPLFAGQVITARHVTDQSPARDPIATLEAGQRVVSVPVKAEAVLGGAMRPGDRVDVVAAWPGPEGKPGPVETLAMGVTVVDLRNAAGGSTATRPDDQANLDSAVPTAALLIVNMIQAKAVVAAVEAKAAVYLWLSGRDRP